MKGTKDLKVTKCCICGQSYTGYGNNAEPVKKGRCCDKCNNLVIQARIEQMNASKKETK